MLSRDEVHAAIDIYSMRMRAIRRISEMRHHGEKELVEASIVGEFGMEGADEHVGLASSYDAAVDLSEDFDTFAYLLDEGGTDKGHGHRTEATQLADGIEAAQLTAVGIATGMDTHHVEVFVIEHDEAGTGAQDGQAVENSLADRREELLIAHDTHHGSTLATGDDEATASSVS